MKTLAPCKIETLNEGCNLGPTRHDFKDNSNVSTKSIFFFLTLILASSNQNSKIFLSTCALQCIFEGLLEEACVAILTLT
jgi:hypothetical protein